MKQASSIIEADFIFNDKNIVQYSKSKSLGRSPFYSEHPRLYCTPLIASIQDFIVSPYTEDGKHANEHHQ